MTLREPTIGEIRVDRHHLNRLPTDSAGTFEVPYQRAFTELARTRSGRPVAETLPLLRRAADHALPGFTGADLREHAQAISAGEVYVLRVTVV